MKRAPGCDVEILQPLIRMPRDHRVLVMRDRVPAETEVVDLSITIEDLRKTGADLLQCEVLQLSRNVELAPWRWDGDGTAGFGGYGVCEGYGVGVFQQTRVRWRP